MDLDEKLRLPGGRKIPVLLVCNKSDLPKDPNLPSDLEISKIVQENNFIPKWFRTSAKNGDRVKDAFNVIVRYIMAMDTWNEPLKDPDGILESATFASQPGSLQSLQGDQIVSQSFTFRLTDGSKILHTLLVKYYSCVPN